MAVSISGGPFRRCPYIRALLFGVCITAPDFWKLAYLVDKYPGILKALNQGKSSNHVGLLLVISGIFLK